VRPYGSAHFGPGLASAHFGAWLATGRLHVRRAKNGSPSVHPMQGDEMRALRRLQREQGPSSHVFMTERDGPMTPKAFHALFGRIGAPRLSRATLK
jgi:hypothetical protein